MQDRDPILIQAFSCSILWLFWCFELRFFVVKWVAWFKLRGTSLDNMFKHWLNLPAHENGESTSSIEDQVKANTSQKECCVILWLIRNSSTCFLWWCIPVSVVSCITKVLCCCCVMCLCYSCFILTKVDVNMAHVSDACQWPSENRMIK